MATYLALLSNCVNALPPALPGQADISHITQQDTLLMQALELEYALRLKAQSAAAKSQGQHKAEKVELANSSVVPSRAGLI